MKEQLELVVCKGCDETDAMKAGDPCLKCGEVYTKEIIKKPTAMEIYMHEVSESRDRYIVKVRKLKLSKEAKEMMYKEDDKGEISWKEELMDSPEMKEYFQKMQNARENFMKKHLEMHLSKRDQSMFRIYEELADYFAGGDVVKTLYKGNGHEDSKFGIMINGEEYWMAEKDIEI